MLTARGNMRRHINCIHLEAKWWVKCMLYTRQTSKVVATTHVSDYCANFSPWEIFL